MADHALTRDIQEPCESLALKPDSGHWWYGWGLRQSAMKGYSPVQHDRSLYG
jgi:hypothetical protein